MMNILILEQKSFSNGRLVDFSLPRIVGYFKHSRRMERAVMEEMERINTRAVKADDMVWMDDFQVRVIEINTEEE